MTRASENNPENSNVLSKRTRKKSFVWEHFTVESIGGGCRRACCKRCNQSFAYSSGSKFAGTSHLKRHIALGTCPKNRRQEKKQQRVYSSGKNSEVGVIDKRKRRYRGSTIPSLSDLFDQDNSYSDIAKMIILHDYRLSMVEDSAFITFAQNLQPKFKSLTFSAIESECIEIYEKERQNLKEILGSVSGRVSLSIDPWMSRQSLRYMSVIGQFIDDDWKLHRYVLNFMLVSSNTGNALTDTVARCLSSWGLENRLFSITLNNGSSNDGISSDLRGQLSNKNALVLNGQLFIASYAHILNVVAQDGVGAVHDIIYKARESIKYVNSLPEGHFAEVALQLQIESTKHLVLDVPMQWNTTYIMLLSALEYKQAFSYLETCDSNYTQAPSVDDWHKIEILCRYLKVLYDAESLFMGISTANVYFHEAWKIKLELTEASMNEDAKTVVGKMHEKYEQYWKDCILILSIAVIMDPRFKMKLVQYSFSKIYGEDANTYVKTVNDGLRDLYLEYCSQPSDMILAHEEQEKTDGVEGATVSKSDGLQDFDAFVSELSSIQPSRSELDQYLEDALVPRVLDFDILNWWKLNQLKYPTLSRMALDVLAIPFCTTPPELVFSTENRILDDYQSCLRPETLQALVCAKDWLQQQQQPLQVLQDLSKAVIKREL